MTTPTSPYTTEWTAVDAVARFGPIPLRRIRHDPAPGTATEQDVLDIQLREKRLYELVDGVLLEKTVGMQESFLAVFLAKLLWDHVIRHDLGFVLGADGMARLSPGLVRIPDVSYVAWTRYPGKQVPRLSMLDCAPDLAIEVLSPSNTQQEMDEKLRDYFRAGVRLVWYVDPARRIVEVFAALGQSTTLREGDTLAGDPILPGFSVAVRDLFARLES